LLLCVQDLAAPAKRGAPAPARSPGVRSNFKLKNGNGLTLQSVVSMRPSRAREVRPEGGQAQARPAGANHPARSIRPARFIFSM
jgi:hypothetical protein